MTLPVIPTELGLAVGGAVAGVALKEVVAWAVRDLLNFRTRTVPNLITSERCLSCKDEMTAAFREAVADIRQRLDEGQESFALIALMLERICNKLSVGCPEIRDLIGGRSTPPTR